ncbi:unnamed protein product [Hymenolepis diminuta]|uniref:Uncharacterized protein n=1 Tax=Hymenolepis diminuta TaxID=6216 RepID=A0A0R3SU81_HYMDI|nr:unnamed protein product [Hymenolepis diminuta]
MKTFFLGKRQGTDAVQSEFTKEMLRISERNLGRDDRIISDHGCQASHPFLDENADLSLPRGEGEKHLLREVAASLTLLLASRLPKRAFQFGSRIAKTVSLHKVVGADSNPFSAE